MNVTELIAKLSTIPGNTEIVVVSDNFELSGANVTATNAKYYPQAKYVERHFTDAFDDTSYPVKVWHSINGDKSIIVIS